MHFCEEICYYLILLIYNKAFPFSYFLGVGNSISENYGKYLSNFDEMKVIFNDRWESILIFLLDHISYRWSVLWTEIEIYNGWDGFGEIVTLVFF